MSMALFSSPSSTHLPSLSPPHCNGKPQLVLKSYLSLRPKRQLFFLVSTRATDNGSGVAVTVEEDKVDAEEKAPETPVKSEESKEVALESNGSPSPPADVAAAVPVPEVLKKFEDSRWVNGTWDLKQFQKDGKTNWDAVIDAGESISLLFYTIESKSSIEKTLILMLIG